MQINVTLRSFAITLLSCEIHALPLLTRSSRHAYPCKVEATAA